MAEKYTRWDNVPSHLMTKTQLRNIGLNPAANQTPAAKKVGGYGPYSLYDLNEAVERRRPSSAQLAALEKARLIARTCKRCGEVFPHHTYLREKQLCWRCADEIERIKAYNGAILWARNALQKRGEVCMLDTETTGMDYGDEVIQLGVIDLEGNVLFDSLFKPTVPVSPGAWGTHGIGDDVLKDAPKFEDHHESIQAILNQRPHVIIYNRDFDTQILDSTCERYGLSELKAESWWCAMRAFARFYGEWSSYHKSYTWRSLSTAIEYFNLPIVDAHHAVGDCLMTLAVVKAMAESEPKK